MTSIEHSQPPMKEIEVYERGMIAKMQIKEIVDSLAANEHFMRAGGRSMLRNDSKGRVSVTFPSEDGHISVSHEVRNKLTSLAVTWHKRQKQIETGRVRGIFLQHFKDFSGAIKGALSYREHAEHQDDNPFLEGTIVETNNAAALSLIEGFKSRYIKTA